MKKHFFQNTLFELLFKNLGTCAPKKKRFTQLLLGLIKVFEKV